MTCECGNPTAHNMQACPRCHQAATDPRPPVNMHLALSHVAGLVGVVAMVIIWALL